MRFYIICAALIAFIAMECTGVYWMMNGSLPPPLLRVDPTVLAWLAAGVTLGAAGALYSMFKYGVEP